MSEGDRIPGVVLAVVVLLGVGGAYKVLSILLHQSWATVHGGVGLVLGTLYVLVAYHLYRRRRWARTTLLLLCAIGLAVALIGLVSNVSTGVLALAGPVLYAVLITRPSARAWFARSPA
jgi:peptidoglycan/LPS O-acetylase OafA/YrhL